MSLAELDIIYSDNPHLIDKVNKIKEYIKLARLNYGENMHPLQASVLTKISRDTLIQILDRGVEKELFEPNHQYCCSKTDKCIGKLEADISPPFEAFCDICGTNHVFTDKDIKKSYKILIDTKEAITSEFDKKGTTEIENKFDNIDFGIITVIDMELESVLKNLSDYQKVTEGSRTYYLCNISTSSKNYNIAVVKCPNPGSNASAVITTDIINQFDPTYIVKIGIAAGYKSDVELGDVVISNQVFIHDYTKEEDEKSRIRHEPYRIGPNLHNAVDNFRWDGPLKNIENFKDKSECVIGHIASGNKLIRSKATLDKIREITHDKVIALEMEGGGIATAANQKNKEFMIINGISDYGDNEKNDKWHEFSADAASKYFVDLLKMENI